MSYETSGVKVEWRPGTVLVITGKTAWEVCPRCLVASESVGR